MNASQTNSVDVLPPVLRFGESAAAGADRRHDDELVVDVDRLIASRLLIQAESDGGKSWMVRYLLEQTQGLLPHILFDIEGEFASLRERYPYVLVSATEGEDDLPARPAAAKALCRKLSELGASVILDLYDLEGSEQQRFVRLFLEELLSLPRSMWGPRLVVVDEAERLAPEKGAADSSAAVTDLAKRGRKRGFGAVLAVQRLSGLDKDAAGGLQNKLIGLTTLDTDVRRAGDSLGFDRSGRAALQELPPGQFFAYAPAIPHGGVVRIRSGEVSTTHGRAGEGAALPPPPAPAALSEVLARLAASLPDEEGKEDDHGEERPGAPDEVLDGLKEKVARAERKAEDLADRCSTLEGENARLRAAVEDAEGHARSLLGVLSGDAPAPVVEQEGEEQEPAPATKAPAGPGRPAEDAPPALTANGRPRRDARHRILAALRDLEALGVASLPRNNLAVFAGQGPRSSAFRDHLAALKDEDLVAYPSPGAVALAEKGRSAVGTSGTDARTLEDLHDAWRRRLPPATAAVLSALLERHPEDLPREELAVRSGQSPRSSAFRDRIAELRSLGLIEYPAPGRVRATKLLFPEGLASRSRR